MKYYKELINIETEIIHLETVKSLVSVLSNGVDTSNKDDIVNALYVVEETLGTVHDGLRNTFNVAFDTIRDDTLKTNVYVPQKDHDLESVMREWVKG